jgi:hypothetical protein
MRREHLHIHVTLFFRQLSEYNTVLFPLNTYLCTNYDIIFKEDESRAPDAHVGQVPGMYDQLEHGNMIGKSMSTNKMAEIFTYFSSLFRT